MRNIGDSLNYEIDGSDRIVAVDEAWNIFASGNGGGAFLAPGILGRRLWDSISDPTTIQIYRDAVAAARRGRTLRFPFRCDAPDRRRTLTMEIAAVPSGNVRFTTTMRAMEPVKGPVPDFAPRAEGSSLVRACGWCKRIHVDETGTWCELDEAVGRLGIFTQGRPLGLTHGICPPCEETMKRLIEARRARAEPPE